MISEKDKKAIDEIMDWFDFQKVHDCMTALNWKWAMYNGYRVPIVPELRSKAREVLYSCCKNNSSQFSTGGFVATRHEGGVIDLSFVVAQYDILP